LLCRPPVVFVPILFPVLLPVLCAVPGGVSFSVVNNAVPKTPFFRSSSLSGANPGSVFFFYLVQRDAPPGFRQLFFLFFVLPRIRISLDRELLFLEIFFCFQTPVPGFRTVPPPHLFLSRVSTGGRLFCLLRSSPDPILFLTEPPLGTFFPHCCEGVEIF